MSERGSNAAGILGGVVAVLGVGAIGYSVVALRRAHAARAESSTHPARASASTASSPMATSTKNFNAAYSLPIWRFLFTARNALTNYPIDFIMDSIKEESGGNPCTIGNPEQYGPDGNPRELGIFQLYNPDDLKLVRRTGAQMRAYCNPNKVQYHLRDGRMVMGPSQEVSRLLTSEEMGAEVDAVLAKIGASRASVLRCTTENGVTWPLDSKDFWRLVKLWHGLPGLVSTGLHAVAKYLGRPPRSWAEYRHLVQTGTVKCDAGTEAYRGNDGFAHVFDNAENATANMPGQALA